MTCQQNSSLKVQKNMETKINITSIIWYSQAPHLLDFELLSWELGVWTLLMASKVTISHGPFAAWWSNALPPLGWCPCLRPYPLDAIGSKALKIIGIAHEKFWVFRPVTFTSQTGWWPLFSTTSLLVFCLLPSLSYVPPKFLQCAQVLPITLLLLSYQNPGSLLTSTHLFFSLVGQTNFPSTVYIFSSIVLSRDSRQLFTTSPLILMISCTPNDHIAKHFLFPCYCDFPLFLTSLHLLVVSWFVPFLLHPYFPPYLLPAFNSVCAELVHPHVSFSYSPWSCSHPHLYSAVGVSPFPFCSLLFCSSSSSIMCTKHGGHVGGVTRKNWLNFGEYPDLITF